MANMIMITKTKIGTYFTDIGGLHIHHGPKNIPVFIFIMGPYLHQT